MASTATQGNVNLGPGYQPFNTDPNIKHKLSLLLSAHDKVGCLEAILSVFRQFKWNLLRIESRPAQKKQGIVEFLVDVEGEGDKKELLAELLEKCSTAVSLDSQNPPKVRPFLPRSPKDLDALNQAPMEYSIDLAPNHPGFHDEEYKARRKTIGIAALNWRWGDPIQRIEYSKAEVDTWREVYRNLKKLFPTHANHQFNKILVDLEREAGYNENNIPQLQDVSNFLNKRTGWLIRPTPGLLDSRTFINAMAFRIFHSTQYIRHSSQPLYTPEPDCCHELIGHVPMLADPEFANFCQQLGMASLGVSDADMEKIVTCYWWTVEFGLCREEHQLKAYGAGLLSSFGELEYCLSDKPGRIPFEAEKSGLTKYNITEYQPHYFVAESFESATKKFSEWANQIERPYAVRYDPYTRTIEVLDTADKIAKTITSVEAQLAELLRTLKHSTLNVAE